MIQRYALLKENRVVKIHILNVDSITAEDGSIDYSIGSELLASLHNEPSENFIPCYRNGDEGAVIGQIGIHGWIYDREESVFRPQKPFPSWNFNSESWEWEAPIGMPDDGEKYYWDEDSTSWKVAAKIPVV